VEIKSISDFRKAMRNGPYAWPGGYPCYFLTSDGESLSFKAVRQELKQVLWSIAHKQNDGWRVIALDINWEDDNIFCAHTGERIESAYGTEA